MKTADDYINEVGLKRFIQSIFPRLKSISFNEIEYKLRLVKSVVQYFFEYEWTDSSLILKSQIFYGNHHKLNKIQLIELAKYLDYIHSKGVYHGDIHLRNIFVKNIFMINKMQI